MKDKELQDILKQFSRLEPRGSFARESKMRVCALPQRSASASAELASYPAFFQRSISSLTFAVASVLIILGIYTMTRELSPLFLPGLNQKKISAEAESVNKQIDIELSQIAYFQNASKESSRALKQVTQPQLDHLNETLIENEARNVTSSPAIGETNKNQQTNREIQDILQEISK